jgi:hypothetical protein
MVLDDPDAEEDHAFARAQVERITVPWRAIPGNHDVGDTQPRPYKDQAVIRTLGECDTSPTAARTAGAMILVAGG